MALTRRELLKSAVLMALVGYNGLEIVYKLNEKDQREIVKKIFSEEAKDYHHLAEHHSTLEHNGYEFGEVGKGYGIILDGLYCTCAHIADNTQQVKRTPFGTMHFTAELKEMRTLLYGKDLDKLVYDLESDIAIFRVPEELNLPDFPGKINDNVNLGDEVYILGNPNLNGYHPRKATIADIDGNHQIDYTGNYIGLDTFFVGGDSGTATINSKGELIGINAMRAGGFGYFKKIADYKKHTRFLK